MMANINNIVKIIITSVVIIISSYLVAQLSYEMTRAEMNISISQDRANITINNESVEPGSVYLKPGKYMVSAFLNGYYEYRKLYEISGNQNVKISIDLKKKPTQTIESLLFEAGGYKTVTEKYPVVKKLPYITRLLKIAYSEDSTLDLFTIVIEAPDGYRSAAVNKIKSWGYNPADYKITFKDYRNPFAL